MPTSSPPRGLTTLVKAMVTLTWLALAAPLLSMGFGSDVDAWLVGQRALQIWASGTYRRSRSTGFPLYELIVTPLVQFGGWFAANAFSALCALALLWMLFRLADRGRLRHALVTIITFMFLPVVFKNATSTIDYAPTLALLMAAYLSFLNGRMIVFAAIVGVACGVRPSNGLFIVPAVVSVLATTRDVRTAARMSITAVVVGTAAFWPSLRLGSFGIAPVTTALNGVLNGMRLFGIVQTLVLSVFAAFILWRSRRAIVQDDARAFVVFHTVNIVVWIGFFALLPGEPDYLVPTIPSVILLLDRFATRQQMKAAAIVLLSFHIVALEVTGSRGGSRRPSISLVPGLTIRDMSDRRFKVWLREATNRYQANEPLLLMEQIIPPIVGKDWVYDSQLDVMNQRNGSLAVSQRITDVGALRAIRAAGYRVVVWRQREWEYQQPAHRDAQPFIEFIEDPGALLSLPMQGMPAELTQ